MLAAPSKRPMPPCMCARRAGGTSRGSGWSATEHDPEKRAAVFRTDHAQTINALKRGQIFRHVAELAQQRGVAEFAGHWIAAAAKCNRADMAGTARQNL